MEKRINKAIYLRTVIAGMNLQKHPYTYNYSQITTSKSTHIHTTTLKSQPQKTPIYTLQLPDHNLKKHPSICNYSQVTTSKSTHIHTTTPRSQSQKTPIYTLQLTDHNLKDTALKSINIKKWG